MREASVACVGGADGVSTESRLLDEVRGGAEVCATPSFSGPDLGAHYLIRRGAWTAARCSQVCRRIGLNTNQFVPRWTLQQCIHYTKNDFRNII